MGNGLHMTLFTNALLQHKWNPDIIAYLEQLKQISRNDTVILRNRLDVNAIPRGKQFQNIFGKWKNVQWDTGFEMVTSWLYLSHQTPIYQKNIFCFRSPMDLSNNRSELISKFRDNITINFNLSILSVFNII